MNVSSYRFLWAGVAIALSCLSARAEIFDLDFETDPQDLGVQFFGTSEWRENGGFNDTGYLSITDAANDQRGAIVFPDLAGGGSLTAFSIQADLRVGGGTGSPADGFSFNFARPGDPVLDDGEGWAASPTNEANLPEEGTTTGLGIGFDEWFSGGADVIGMSIRIDNELVNQFPFPTQNGDVDDTTSLQTGPAGVFPDELQDLMGWAPLAIELCANNLTVTYKGVEVFNEPLEYDPSPGRLVFGGRTGGSNAYHHIDNIVVRTGDDVGAGCTVVPPSYVAGQGTIGVRSFDGTQSNEVYGPQQDGISGWSLKLVDTDLTVDTLTLGQDVLDNDDGIVSTGLQPAEDDEVPYPVVDLAGGIGTFSRNLPYPNGVANETMEDFALQAVAEVVIPAGTWTIGFGSDDGGAVQIPGVEFLDSLNNDNFENDEIRFELPRGHSWTVGTFELSEPLETAILGSFFERGGGDSFEIAVIEGDAIADVEVDGVSPDNGWQLLGDGVLGWSIKTSGTPLLSADLTDAVVTDRPVEFDVDGDTGMADQLTIPNPDPNVYTTTLDIDGITFQIASTGTLSPGEAFDIIDVDQIVGTPIITSLVPGQTWSFNSATGQIIFGATLAGDYNSDGVVDTADIDLQAVAMQSPTTNLATFDENGDGTINEDDRVIWVTQHAKTWFGDANFDGSFTTDDLVAVFAAGKYETGNMAVWSEGDWTGDMVFDSGDLVAAFSDGGFELGPRQAVAAVPEPSSVVLLLLSAAGLVGATRRRNG